MKIKVLLLATLCNLVSFGQQNDPTLQKKTKQAMKLIKGTDVIIQDISRGLALLDSCASQGYAPAAYRLGGIYNSNKTVVRNKDLAFQYMKTAAEAQHPKAACRLGKFYKYGIGCTIDLDKAMHWYEKSYELGSDMGAFLIGYMYLKGLGTIAQDYQKAITWFTRSTIPKAKLWLAVCHYFGYGVPQNKELARKMLIENSDRKDFQILYQHLEADTTVLAQVISEMPDEVVQQETDEVNKILTAERSIAIESDSETAIDNALLQGKWKGHLIELDWSGERMLRKFPAQLTLAQNEDEGLMDCTATLHESESTDVGIVLDKSIYFEKIGVRLPRIYRNHDTIPAVDYRLLGADLEVKQLDQVRYLTAYLDTHAEQLTEPGPPMLLILANTNAFTNDGAAIDDDILKALIAAQDTHFITVYPNPFVSDLLIQFELAAPSQTSVEIYSLDGLVSETIAPSQTLDQGVQLYQFDGEQFHRGMYIIRVTVDQTVHTKLVIKE